MAGESGAGDEKILHAPTQKTNVNEIADFFKIGCNDSYSKNQRAATPNELNIQIIKDARFVFRWSAQPYNTGRLTSVGARR